MNSYYYFFTNERGGLNSKNISSLVLECSLRKECKHMNCVPPNNPNLERHSMDLSKIMVSCEHISFFKSDRHEK